MATSFESLHFRDSFTESNTYYNSKLLQVLWLYFRDCFHPTDLDIPELSSCYDPTLLFDPLNDESDLILLENAKKLLTSESTRFIVGVENAAFLTFDKKLTKGVIQFPPDVKTRIENETHRLTRSLEIIKSLKSTEVERNRALAYLHCSATISHFDDRECFEYAQITLSILEKEFAVCPRTVIVTIPFVRAGIFYWCKRLNFHTDANVANSIDKKCAFFDLVKIQALQQHLITLLSNPKLSSSQQENLKRFADEVEVLSDPFVVNKIVMDLRKNGRVIRRIVTGTANVGKVLILQLLQDRCIVRKRKHCGGFDDQNHNPASLTGLHAALEANYAFTEDREGAVVGRGHFEGALWRCIMLVIHQANSPQEYSNVAATIIQHFQQRENELSLAFHRSHYSLIVLDGDEEANKTRMRARGELGDLHRSFINMYIRAQNACYFAAAVFYKQKVQFVPYGDEKSSKFDWSSVDFGTLFADALNLPLKKNNEDESHRSKEGVAQRKFTCVHGATHALNTDDKRKMYAFAKAIEIYK